MNKKFNRKNTTASILGTEYKIIFKSEDETDEFELQNAAAICNTTLKEILVCTLENDPAYIGQSSEYLSTCYRDTLRHEIIHAFLFESGLERESHHTQSGWALDEEIIDWFAIQFPKIVKVFKELDLI